MARPLLSPSELRSRVEVYLNPLERHALSGKAKTAGLPLATYVRKAALGHQIKVPQVVEIAKWGELARLSANLNQIAHAVNCGQPIPFDPFVLIDIRREVEKLRAELLGSRDPDGVGGAK